MLRRHVAIVWSGLNAILLDSDTKTLNIGMKINKENILEILKNPTKNT